MSKRLRALTAAAAVAAATLVGTNGMANAIGGGVPIHNQSIVQLDVGSQYATWKCTGEAIASQWVLTARHCTDSINSANVYYSNSTTDRGPAYKGDRFLASPNGDVGLIHLASPHAITYYSKLATSYTPKAGETMTIAGYGHRSGGALSDGLYRAKVEVLGAGDDLYGGSGIHVQGIDGNPNKGDSGGPMRNSDNRIVGVDSRGDYSDGGTGIHSRSYWANITASRDWIKQQTGV